jgi:hypothetical protein
MRTPFCNKAISNQKGRDSSEGSAIFTARKPPDVYALLERICGRIEIVGSAKTPPATPFWYILEVRVAAFVCLVKGLVSGKVSPSQKLIRIGMMSVIISLPISCQEKLAIVT